MVNEELKPCPFCGGEAVRMNFLDNPPFPNTIGTRYFGCRKCCVVSFTGMTEEEATEAWNTRAERTCTIERYTEDCIMFGRHAKRNVSRCSSCKQRYVHGNYCPNCGARVVE